MSGNTRTGNWQSRLLAFNNIDDAVTEYHVLWGNDVEPKAAPWITVVEDRGAEIWIPLLKETKLKKRDLPLRLKIKQVIDYDPKYHLAGIVDAALVGLFDQSCKKLLLPTNSQSCS